MCPFQFEYRGRKSCRVPDMDKTDAEANVAADSSDEEYIPEFLDSDIDLQDGDDDLFDINVDDGKGKATLVELDDPYEDEDMYLPYSKEEPVKMNFKSFRQEDLTKPKFEVD